MVPVVEIVPVLVVEMMPVLVVEMVPLFEKPTDDIANIKSNEHTGALEIFICLLLAELRGYESGGYRTVPV